MVLFACGNSEAWADDVWVSPLPDWSALKAWGFRVLYLANMISKGVLRGLYIMVAYVSLLKRLHCLRVIERRVRG